MTGLSVGLTEDEHAAMDLTAQLANLVIGKIIGSGPSREGDVHEFVAQIHGIQATILSQAAGRAHPERYRLLGDVAPGKCGVPL